MDAVTFWRLGHLLALFLMMAGLGATMLPVYRSWSSKDISFQMHAFSQAAANETGLLLPGVLLTGATGVFWGSAAGYHFIRDGWLLAMWLLYVLIAGVCLPLLGLSLRRIRLFALQAAKTGKATPELEEALHDNVPLVFGTLIIVLSVIITWLAIYKPF